MAGKKGVKRQQKKNSNYKTGEEIVGQEAEIIKPSINGKLLASLIAVIVITAVVCFIGRAYLKTSPFEANYQLEGPTNVFTGVNGKSYIIDGGKKTLLVVNEKNEMEYIIDGGNEDTGYFYASLVCDDKDGNIYVADAVYSDEGTKLKCERILKYSPDCKSYEIIHVIDYSQTENPPLQYGAIKSIEVNDGVLTYTLKTDDGVSLRRIDTEVGEDNDVSEEIAHKFGYDIWAASADAETSTVAVATKLGEVYRIDADGKITCLFETDDASIPWSVDIYDGKVYCADINDCALKSIPLFSEGPQEWTVEYEFGDLCTVSIADGRLTGTNCAGIYSGSNGEYNYYDAPVKSNFAARCAVWVCAALGAVAVATLIITLVGMVRGSNTETIYRVVIVIIVSLVIATLVSYIILSAMINNQNDTIMKELNSFCDIMIESTDADRLEEIDSIDDYKNTSFNEVKGKLDNLVEKSYDNGLYYYYAIYVTDGEYIYCVMDYEETVTSMHPVYEYGDNNYTVVLSEGVDEEVSRDVSSYGAWSFVLKPIHDSDGNVIALMEVGTSLDRIIETQNELIFEIVVTVLSSVVVIVMLMLEAIFFLSYSEKRKRTPAAELDIVDSVPLRTLIFMTFLTDSMQDSFITLLSARLFDNSSFIPREIGITLPLAMQVLMAAIFAFVGGKLVNLIGTKKNLFIGIVIEMIGFTICAFSGTYWGILIGKTVFGIGMGLVIVTINTVAALGRNEESSSRAFANINAGVLAGVTAGVGIGSVILSISNYKTVYMTTVILLFFSLLIALKTRNHTPHITKPEKGKTKLNAFTFVFRKEIFTFAIFLLVPFMIALSYREVFFPIYAEGFGLNEVWIGRIYLICGLVVIYVGPMLTKLLIEKFGNKWTVVIASILMCSIMLLFVLMPSIQISILGLIILSVAISFGYAAQSTYYSTLKSVNEFGEGRAMGVYSLFENAGQTLGPIIYGVAITMGNVFGLAIIGCVMVVLLMLFVLTSSLKAKKK